MSSIAFGPRRVSARRLVSVPRPVLETAGLSVPTMVRLELTTHRVTLSAARAHAGVVRWISRVGQLMLPHAAVEALELAEDRLVYARVSGPGHIELLSTRHLQVVETGSTP